MCLEFDSPKVYTAARIFTNSDPDHNHNSNPYLKQATFCWEEMHFGDESTSVEVHTGKKPKTFRLSNLSIISCPCSARHQFTLWDHRYGAGASCGACMCPSSTGTESTDCTFSQWDGQAELTGSSWFNICLSTDIKVQKSESVQTHRTFASVC